MLMSAMEDLVEHVVALPGRDSPARVPWASSSACSTRTRVLGGTGWDATITLAHAGIPETGPLDYTLYPGYPHSLGFTQRGCRLHCPFCVVPRKEGRVQPVATIAEIWRGEPWPRHILLLDNDFFGPAALASSGWRRSAPASFGCVLPRGSMSGS